MTSCEIRRGAVWRDTKKRKEKERRKFRENMVSHPFQKNKNKNIKTSRTMASSM